MSSKKQGRPKKPILIETSCVFAVCNQQGQMREYIDKQRYCMIIQNSVFEVAVGVPNKVNDECRIDKVFWHEHGYNVPTLARHDCEHCNFYKSKYVWKLVPYYSADVKYTWTVEKQGRGHEKNKGRTEKKKDD